MDIPTPERVSADWLTERLREAGHPAVEVRGFDATRIGTGQLGSCYRYALDRVGDESAPKSLIGKFPSDDPASRQTGVMLRNYRKEVGFYRDLQARMRMRTPRCYYAAIEGDGPEHVLLLEDLAPAEQGDQLAGCSPEVARAAVLQLPGLHAPTWCDESLKEIDWLGHPTEQTIQLGRALYSANLGPFLERFAPRLEKDEADVIARAADSQGPPFEPLGEVFSIVHVDYRLDNLLIDEREDPPRVTAVDWQSLTVGNPLADVAYFLGAGLQPEVRRPVEREIVEAYHAALCEAGVRGYAWERCWEDYRRGTFNGFAVTVVASVMVQQTERGDEMFTAMARRHARHALDLGADELFAG